MSLSISLLRQIIRESLSRPKIYVLVGPQGVGKSYWVEQNVSDPYIISYDKVVDIVRKPLGLKYDEIAGPRAGAHRKEIERLHKDNVKGASASSKDIVVDMSLLLLHKYFFCYCPFPPANFSASCCSTVLPCTR
jgi:GTPase SAR1 family protein